jgi:hypothetical protein
MKEELKKDMEKNSEKKNQTEILELKPPFNQIKKYSRRLFQQTRACGKQNLRVQK